MKYIPDREIDLTENDLLQTYPYVETLVEIIKNSETPFTIGLFGGWGSGKSSIVKTLKKVLKNDRDAKIKVVIYDAWKYSKDSFRRTFILELKKQLELDTTEDLEPFYRDRHEEVDHRIALNKAWWVNLFVFSPLLLLLIWLFGVSTDLKIVVSLIGIFSAVISYILSNSLFEYKLSITKPKIFSPEQFEEIFVEIINAVTREGESRRRWVKGLSGNAKDVKKLVIVIDNIDRCHKDLAFELLLTIKTFLEKEGVIFVIPIDDVELKKYLEEAGYNANEFLRKMFNTTISIKKFSETDLYDFAKILNENYGLNLPDVVISLISQEFSKNPRKIIQFINVLQTEIKLAEKLERIGNVPKGSITDNLHVLTKILIIREEIPELYKLLEEHPSIFNEINMSLAENSNIRYDSEKRLYQLEVSNFKLALNPDQYRFLSRTQNISCDDIESILVNKDAFADIPDEINKLVLSQDWENIKSSLEKREVSFEKLMNFIDIRFKKDVIDRGLWETTGFNIFSLIFKIANDEDFSTDFWDIFNRTGLLDTIKSALNNRKILDLIPQFPPSNLIKFAKTLNISGNSTLTNVIAEAINQVSDSTIARRLVEEFINNFSDDKECLEKIKPKFSEILKTDPSFYKNLEITVENEDVISYLVSTETLEEFINTLNPDPNKERTQEKVEFIKLYHKSCGLSESLLQKYIEKVLGFLNNTNWSTLNFWMDKLHGFIEKVDNVNLHSKIFNILNQGYQFLYNSYVGGNRSVINVSCYKAFLNLAKELYIVTDQFSNQVIGWLNSFFSRDESPEVYLHVNKLYYEIIEDSEIHNWSFSQYIVDKFNGVSEWSYKQKLAETLNLMLKKTIEGKGLQPDQISSILNSYLGIIRTHPDKSRIAIDWIKDVLKNDIIKNALNSIIQRLKHEDIIELLDIVKEISDERLLKEAITKVLRNTECESLKKVLDTIQDAKVNQRIVKTSVEEVLKGIKEDDNPVYYRCFLEFVVGHRILNDGILKILIDKIKSLLINEKKEDNILALKLLSEIEIPQEKEDVVRVLLNDLKTELFTDEEIELLKRVKEKCS